MMDSLVARIAVTAGLGLLTNVAALGWYAAKPHTSDSLVTPDATEPPVVPSTPMGGTMVASNGVPPDGGQPPSIPGEPISGPGPNKTPGTTLPGGKQPETPPVQAPSQTGSPTPKPPMHPHSPLTRVPSLINPTGDLLVVLVGTTDLVGHLADHSLAVDGLRKGALAGRLFNGDVWVCSRTRTQAWSTWLATREGAPPSEWFARDEFKPSFTHILADMKALAVQAHSPVVPVIVWESGYDVGNDPRNQGLLVDNLRPRLLRLCPEGTPEESPILATLFHTEKLTIGRVSNRYINTWHKALENNLSYFGWDK